MSEVFLKIVNMSISASWLVLAVLLLRLALKRAPKWISVLLWGLVAFRLICPFSIESTFSLIPSAETISKQVIAGPSFNVQTGIPQIDASVNDYIGDRYYEGVTVPTNYGFHVVTVLTIVWWVGIAAMLLYTAVSYFLLRRKVVTAVLLRNNIYQSEIVDSPFVLGIVKPKIYLPFRLDTRNLALVLAHEEAHIRRKDHWWKPFGFLLLALHWFNPLVWLGYILLCRDIELACDEKVIKEMDNENRADYTQALVACSVNRRSIAACPLAFGEVGVKDRVKSVMNYKKPAFWIFVAAIVSCIAVAVCFLTNPKTNANNQVSLPQNIQDPNASQFAAMVLEVHDNYLLVAPEGGSPLSYADKVEISLAGLEIPPALQIGETVLIVYDGYVQEVYPPRIDSAYRVERLYLDSGPIETIYGNVKTYFRNTNGTWQTGGRNYKYRHELSGWIPNAINNTTYVYLSNQESLTVEQVWQATGFSNNIEDYFYIGNSILVEYSHEINVDELTLLLPAAWDAALTKAILQKHADTVPDGYLATESHILVGQTPVFLDGPPLDEYDEITLHVYYLHQLFDVSGDYPVERTGIYQEAAIAFEKDEEGNYIEKGFFRPQYSAEYIEELAPFLTFGNAKIEEYQQQYAEQLLNSCWASATAYIESRNASEAMPKANYGVIIDRITHDIDEDGKEEICTLTYGQTSGLFSFCFYISPAGGDAADIQYSQTYVLRGHYYLSFELGENGQLRIKGERNIDPKEVVYFDIAVKDSRILLQCDEEGIFLK